MKRRMLLMMLSLLLSVVSNAQIILPSGYENFDNKLTFPCAKESGIYSDYCTPTLAKASWNYPGELISQLKSISSINNRFAADYDFIYNGDGFEFVDGRYRGYEDSLLIQVSQNDMDMTNAEIALINSDGEDMIEIGYVEVVNVKRHNETGLWVIKFKLNEAKIDDLLDKDADYLNEKYAVAVKGVDYMVSGYDVCLGLEEVKHAYDFNVNGVSVSRIHNRYIKTDETFPMIWTDDADFYKNSFSHELTWNSDVPYSSILNNSQTVNTCDRYGHSLTNQRETSGTDNRHVQEILPVHFNCLKDDAEWAKIDIDYPTVNENGEFTPIRGFFVTLDSHFAIESSNSEINAWTMYIYKNVAKYPYNLGKKDTSLSELEEPITLQPGNKGTIYIKNDRNVLWDVIGFRVHAVNLDGTLTDPDGRAFYVKVYNAVIDGIYYTFNLINKTAAVTSGNIDYSGSVTIPPSVTYCGVDFSVTGIDNDAFEGCDNLTSVTIPSSVTSIGNYAFSNCRDLSSVTIPTSVTSIGKFAFDGTTWYNNQPVGLVYADKVLYKYKGTMPENESIVIKDGTLVIADCAFSGCSNLTSVEIPNTVTNIGNSAFQGCTGLTSVTIPNSVTSIGYAVFSGCSGLTSVIIPNSVTSIGAGAFSRCTGLTSVTIPNSVTSIRNSAFSDCFSLTDVYCYAADVPSAENNAFNNTNANVTLHVPASALSAYRSTSPWNNSFNTIDVIGNVPAPKTFDASGLRYTVIPGTSTVSVSATSTALSGCVSIPEVAINEGTPYSVVAIDKVAFYDCTDLTSLTIAKSVKTIGYGAFKGCEALTRLIAIGDEPIVMTNGQDVFAGINFDLCELHVPVDSKSEYEEAEGWCLFSTIVEDIISVDSIISDDGMTCNFNYSITNNNEISLLGVNGDVTVTAGAFTIPSGVTKDGKEYVVTSIAPNAFEDCIDMTSLTIPESITSIGENAFAGCTGLKEIFCFSSVPIDLSTMLARGLMRTTSGTVPTQLEGIDFENCILYVPLGTSGLYREAEGWCLFRNIHELPDSELSMGDVNCDTAVDNLDVNLIGRHVAGKFPSPFVWDAADINHDGEVDIVDVTALIQMLLDKKP